MAPCSKKRYSTSIEAALALRSIRDAAASGTRQEVGIHPCGSCSGFHLTSDRRSAKNKWTTVALAKISASTVSS